MAPASSALFPLGKATSTAIRQALFLIGSRTTGTKDLLLKRLQWEVSKVQASHSRKQRIISIDMGIRNLAFAVCDVRSNKLTVHHWTRMALDKAPSSDEVVDGGKQDDSRSPSTNVLDPDPLDPYHPAQLSQTATDLVHRLLKYAPDTVLIERQRHRSGGGSAVQEWTVRVNSLESMIWSGLRMWASRPDNKRTIEIHGVNPAFVAQFWVRDRDGSTLDGDNQDTSGMSNDDTQDEPSKAPRDKAAKARRKIEKKDKIAVAAVWANPSNAASKITPDLSADTTSPDKGFSIEFEGQASRMRDAFIARLNGKSTRSKKNTLASEGSESTDSPLVLDKNKLDDLADCLLQAGAWVTWQSNRRILAEQMQRQQKTVAEEEMPVRTSKKAKGI